MNQRWSKIFNDYQIYQISYVDVWWCFNVSLIMVMPGPSDSVPVCARTDQSSSPATRLRCAWWGPWTASLPSLLAKKRVSCLKAPKYPQTILQQKMMLGCFFLTSWSQNVATGRNHLQYINVHYSTRQYRSVQYNHDQSCTSTVSHW